MALSPNYGWSEPDNSSLVKNGAADIRTLGDAIDASLWAVGYGQAGKNKIINGDFGVWQRGTSFSNNTTGDVYTADRWVSQVNGTGTRTITQQTFTAGTAPVAGYEGTFFLRMGCSSSGTSTYFNIKQKIEDVRTFAGQTVTVSFWAKASASLTTNFFGLTQDFGSGGSTAVDTAATNLTFTTSYVRYTQTFAIPSISGKTIGTGSNLALAISFGSGTFTSFDIWGVQVEYGSKATPFETATGTIQGELAACQRYYWRFTGGNGNFAAYGTGLAGSTTQCDVFVQFPTTMRIKPTTLEFSTLALADGLNTAAVSTLTVLRSNELGATLAAGATGLIQYRPHQLINNNNSTTAYLGVTAEL